MQWFDVDREGLGKLLAQKGIAFALYELLQNAWDTDAKMVKLTIEPVPGRALARVVVEDDNPTGFTNLSHAFTLFAESEKKGHAEKRGRFNLGEKLVLALCEQAEITTTTGTVIFDELGRHVSRSNKRESGTVFDATMRLTREQLAEVGAAIRLLIPPDGVTTTFNGEPLRSRPTVGTDTPTLPTMIGDGDGVLRRTQRKTKITMHEPLPGETAMLYEMGIPVVETHDRFHVNVHQKVPVNLDRDNVHPSYLRTIRAHVLNATSKLLTRDEAAERWVTDAISHGDVKPEAVEQVITSRFGDKRVIADPSDPEANRIAVSKGYTVIAARSLPSEAWDNVKLAGSALPAGRVTPSPKPFKDGGEQLEFVPREKWTDVMELFETFVNRIATRTTELRLVGLRFTMEGSWGFDACISVNERVAQLTWNLAHVPLTGSGNTKMLAVLIHELAHAGGAGHLTEQFHDECCRIGAELTLLAVEAPYMVKLTSRGA